MQERHLGEINKQLRDQVFCFGPLPLSLYERLMCYHLVFPDWGRRCHLESLSRLMVFWCDDWQQCICCTAITLRRHGPRTDASYRVELVVPSLHLFILVYHPNFDQWATASLEFSCNRYHQFVPADAAIPRNPIGENNFMLEWVPWRMKKEMPAAVPIISMHKSHSPCLVVSYIYVLYNTWSTLKPLTLHDVALLV